jgi:hypothetical protein
MTMRPILTAALTLLLAAPAFAQEPECTTTTTTTTTCKGAAAPLAAPGAEQPYPSYAGYPMPTPQPAAQPYYPPPVMPAPPVLYQPQLMMKSHVEEKPRTGLAIAGTAVFGGLWLMNAMIGYAAGEGRLAIPVIGPLLIANFNGDSGNRSGAVLAMMDTLIQGAGVIMIFAGVMTKKKVTVYDRVAIAPAVLPGGAGLAAMGQF